MKFIYENNSLKSGIYKILNTHTNRIYIGQAKEFKERWKGHKRSLLANKHQNKFLQADFNKCLEYLGHDDFLEFHIVFMMENSTKEERNVKETQMLAMFFDNQINCYNMCKTAFGKQPTVVRTLSQEHKNKISQTMRNKNLHGPWFGKHLPEEVKKKISDANIGNKNAFFGKIHSKESRIKISIANENRIYATRSKPIKITNIKTNEMKTFNSITETKRFLGATKFETIARVLRGERNHYKGWRIEHATSVIGLVLTCNAVIANDMEEGINNPS